MTLEELKIRQSFLPNNQFMQEEFKKTQIILHHTAGGPNSDNVLAGWKANLEKIATAFIISGPGKGCVDGEIVQAFASKHWAYGLGLKESTFHSLGLKYQSLDKSAIQIEVCNYGFVTEKNGKFYTYVNSEIPASEVTKLDVPYKGYQYWHKYSDAQIESLRKLIIFLGEKYGISVKYKEGIFDISKDALSNTPGVYTHNSYRRDKFDVYPCPRLIAMLKSL